MLGLKIERNNDINTCITQFEMNSVNSNTDQQCNTLLSEC